MNKIEINFLKGIEDFKKKYKARKKLEKIEMLEKQYIYIYIIPKNDGDGNKPLLPLLVCKGWITRYSPILVVLPLRLSFPQFHIDNPKHTHKDF